MRFLTINKSILFRGENPLAYECRRMQDCISWFDGRTRMGLANAQFVVVPWVVLIADTIFTPPFRSDPSGLVKRAICNFLFSVPNSGNLSSKPSIYNLTCSALNAAKPKHTIPTKISMKTHQNPFKKSVALTKSFVGNGSF